MVIACSRGRGGKLPDACSVCGGVAGLLCDWPVPGGRTCDASLCGRCSVHVDGKDYCRPHVSHTQERML
jgi:hypothetical protein